MKSKKRFHFAPAGFTLIELLVVIAIIGILSAVILASLNTARARARDARKEADFHSMATALQLFYDAKGRMPLNYHTNAGANQGDGYYEQSMQELVDAGVLPGIPISPGGAVYSYYDYGTGNTVGALIRTVLETAPNTTGGISPSCRPWPPAINWCNQSSSKEYCICVQY